MAVRNVPARDWAAMMLIAAVVGALLITWATVGREVIPHFQGVGFDGWIYAQVAADPVGVIDGRDRLDGHAVNRVGPSLVLHGVFLLAGIEPTSAAIVLAFQIFNFTLVVIGCALWMGIVRSLDLRRATAWFGFTALFCNYAMLKLIVYRPVLTDTAGFTLSLALVLCVVSRKRLGILLVSALAAVTWPTVFYTGLVLFLFDFRRPSARLPEGLARGFSALLAICVLVAATAVLRCGGFCATAMASTGMVPRLLPVSFVVLGLYLYTALRPLLATFDPVATVRAIRWGQAVVAVAVLATAVAGWGHFSDGSGSGLEQTFMNILQEASNKPGGFLVAHAMYVGPGVVLLVLTWRHAVAAVGRLGVGMVLIMGGYLLLSIGSESRKLLNLWPFFAVAAALVVEQRGWSGRRVAVFAAMSVAMSRIWLPLTQGIVRTGPSSVAHPEDQWLTLYRISIGPWMTLPVYAALGACCVVAGAALYWLLSRDVEVEAAQPEAPGAGASSRKGAAIGGNCAAIGRGLTDS